MADTSVDTLLQSLRGASSDFSQAGQGFAQAGQMKMQNDATAQKKADADRILQERTGISAELGPLAEAAQAEDFDQAGFVNSSNSIRKKIVASGQLDQLQALESIERVARDRAEGLKAAAAEKSKGAKETKDAGKDAEKAKLDISDRATAAGDKLRQSLAPLDLAISAAKSAETLTELSKTNPTARATAIRKLARASGDTGVLTDADAAAFGGSTAIAARLERFAQATLDGTATDDDAQFAVEIAQVLKKNAETQREGLVGDTVSRFTTNYGGKEDDNYKRITGRDRPKKDPEEEKKKEAKAKKDAENPLSAGSEDKPKLRVYDTDAWEIERSKPVNQKNFQVVMQRLTEANKAKGLIDPNTGEGLPPNPAELEVMLAKSLGIQVVPKKKN